jgi:hypothetical protein
MYCKNCKHWKSYAETMKYRFDISPDDTERNGGYCHSSLITEDAYNSPYKENSLVYSYYEGGSFWTGAKFGCVNFKEKPCQP